MNADAGGFSLISYCLISKHPRPGFLSFLSSRAFQIASLKLTKKAD